MRRLIGVMMTGALAAAFIPAVAMGSFAPPPSPPFSLIPQLMLRLFGETSDSGASLAAAYGDRTSESPLRDLALRVDSVRPEASFARDVAIEPAFALPLGSPAVTIDSPFDVAQGRIRIPPSNGRFAATPLLAGDAGATAYAVGRTPQSAVFTAGEYQPVEPVPFVSPQPGTLFFGTASDDGAHLASKSSALAFGHALPGASDSSTLARASVRIGPVQFRTRSETASIDVPQQSLNDRGYTAGANFDVRAGGRKLNVDVSSNYERLTRNDTSGMSAPAFDASSTWQLPGADAPLLIPSYADMSKVSVGAALAVPVVNGLTLNLNYAKDRLLGGYGMPGLTNLDATDNSYGGKLSFEIPHSSSTVSLSAQQLRYQDNLLPANTFTQTREDVNFTVKF